jgi:hypothetical protein
MCTATNAAAEATVAATDPTTIATVANASDPYRQGITADTALNH